MILTVKKGNHRFRPAWPWFVFRKNMSYTVTFLPSCRYDIEADQRDWNKLFGVGPISVRIILELFVRLVKFVMPTWFDWLKVPHHRNSYRLAWRYNKDNGVIEIAAYWYHNGVRRSSAVLRNAKLNKPVILAIVRDGNYVYFTANDVRLFSVPGKWPSIGYKLGPYFGGNQPAPHDMKIEMKKL